MTDWLAIIILGIIEGITEFLPISSTAHLLIAEQWLPRQSDLFNIVIQSGAVIAVLPLFPKRLYQFVFGWREKSTRDYALKILLAFVITGIGGLVLDRAGFELPEELWPIAWALLLGGIGFLIIELWLKGRHPHETITWTIAAAVGARTIASPQCSGNLTIWFNHSADACFRIESARRNGVLFSRRYPHDARRRRAQDLPGAFHRPNGRRLRTMGDGPPRFPGFRGGLFRCRKMAPRICPQ